MKTIQTHASFYIELSLNEIKIIPKYGNITVYPIWLGKNRAVMREAISAFKKTPPQTFVDSVDLACHMGLVGMGGSGEKVAELFVEENNIDTGSIFW